MSYDQYQYKVLCEDQNHFHFVRGWLEKKGANPRKIYLAGSLPHPGSGKDYVQNHFEAALKELRSKSQYQKRILIIVMDADNLTCEAVMNDSAFSGSKPSDNVFFIVPRWSIETWIRWLLEPNHMDALDESKSCKRQYMNAAVTSLGKELAELMAQKNTDHMPVMPGSLKRAIADVNKKLQDIV
jgi:hypothetical protein